MYIILWYDVHYALIIVRGKKHERLRLAFDAYDLDGDGFIGADELMHTYKFVNKSRGLVYTNKQALVCVFACTWYALFMCD